MRTIPRAPHEAPQTPESKATETNTQPARFQADLILFSEKAQPLTTLRGAEVWDHNPGGRTQLDLCPSIGRIGEEKEKLDADNVLVGIDINQDGLADCPVDQCGGVIYGKNIMLQNFFHGYSGHDMAEDYVWFTPGKPSVMVDDPVSFDKPTIVQNKAIEKDVNGDGLTDIVFEYYVHDEIKPLVLRDRQTDRGYLGEMILIQVTPEAEK